MPVLISMLRGVNLGSHNRIQMEALRALYESLGFAGVRTYVQSGNVVFRTKQTSATSVAAKIQDAIEKKFKFRPVVIVRTPEDLRKAVARTPFDSSRKLEPSKILITFLASEPAPDARANLDRFQSHPEELHLKGRELYIYFPDGAGRSKLPWSSVEKFLKVTGTARNWNSVLAMLEMAEEMEAGQSQANRR